MLWIALHLPLLSLESFAATLAADGSDAAVEPPLALLEAQRIASANAPAQLLGVKPGLKRATALALAPQLTLGQANPERDVQALQPVAHAALAFTPNVVIQPANDTSVAPHTVLLEVEGSLRYFGGRQQLLQHLHAALAPLGHCIHTVAAPTPQGAALLARIHRQLHCADLAATERALGAAPLWLLGSGREHWQALQGMGLRTFADLRGLPRAGLARRFGVALLNELDRALGTRPDPREPITLPASFETRLELFARADTTEQILHGAGLLLARMVLWLGARHACVRRFTLVMQHETHRYSAQTPQASALEIALAEPSCDRAHLLALLRERLAQLQLPAPTLELRLHADDIEYSAPPNHELFPTPQSDREGLMRLIERLQARLGSGQVQHLLQVQDHRPERASPLQAAAAGSGLQTPAQNPASSRPVRAAPRRPVWLLPEALALRERQSRPLLAGEPLQLLSGPERIESGWWDSDLAERDYFIAQAAGGALVWIYRARLPLSAAAGAQGWFMQGRFG